ncbi:Eco57I restriction-modification methylase domain-containing protein [Microbacterium aurantiacum]|uniref:site-specific DNA-methyltransferase (adenine-specific) n=1 Tax=Microbacterium aurantiacum TaxID=162393 RepID=A0A0M8MG93_9MICO|nr:Eco57I restriction-modification methylase domain-containing protein [Microbacterium chocolatum]ANG86208.1 restriction endonuclease [Microbacterium chocolatum]KOS10888.1 restriction endonuclease [Microbacterium chocolatum]
MNPPIVDGKATFALRGHNPDVLTCIANLSNDEVFTPPELANQMLDTLEVAWAEANDGALIWSDPTVTFLDPFTKSGVFLREITMRLTEGLKAHLPVLEERVDHILTKQVYGVGITRLTGLLARRSVYCSKDAMGAHSIASSFDRDWGNIWFERTEHTWAGDKCAYCGAGKSEYARSDDLETHAYAFIHTTDIKARLARMFGADMQFDVIIGNPPYQLSDGGGSGSSAMPIYHHFIEQAKRLEPRLLTMIIPSKWFSGGKGLDAFRETMLGDRRLRALVDYPDSREAFAGVDVAGGVCYFLWNRDDPGACHVETRVGGESIAAERVLNEFNVFIRDNRVLNLVKKVKGQNDPSLSTIVSARRPFGIDSASTGSESGDLYLYASGGDTRICREYVPRGVELIDKWKVLLSKTSSEHAGQTDKSGRKRVLSRIEIMPPASVATESYLIVGPFSSEIEASNAAAYLRTRFVRFLVSAILLTQNITRGSFAFVPAQDFSRAWTDEDLYAKYALTEDEITLIESQIKPLGLVDA